MRGQINMKYTKIKYLYENTSGNVGTTSHWGAFLQPILHWKNNEYYITCVCVCVCVYYISNKMQRYTVYLYLETALHVSGAISTHHQEHTQLHLQHLVLVKPLLLPAAIVEELELQLGKIFDSVDAISLV